MVVCLALAAAVAFHPDPKDPRQRQLAAMGEELQRAQQSLQLKGHEAPYFISYAVRAINTQEVGAKYGAVFVDRRRRDKRLQVDVRVGSYQLDNTGAQELFELDGADSGYSAGREAPLDDDPAALRNALWLLTDETYKKSLSAYLKKKGKQVYRPDDPGTPPSFSREESRVSIDPPLPFSFERAVWGRELREQTERLGAHPELFDSQMR